ncbi:hypothetical protein QEG98_28105 [Myxococcus sp. MxC21-1]|uniref:hypothetical protein n=1 Tax=Myxococcus sp. MxC21-1 TaxID=3041439 RepID=UPI00292DE780|nr:hypothetical protein [Myxococcus sp. MxC21-1]WNZ59869.1 hypothetical protein QEG98_28105 [Myxococcus sp. MxC21-1]
MQEPTIVTAENLDEISPSDLQKEATQALARGERVELYEGDWNGVRVSTLVVDGYRAGQASNGNASWGDWNEESQTVTLDSGETVDLDGGEVEAA